MSFHPLKIGLGSKPNFGSISQLPKTRSQNRSRHLFSIMKSRSTKKPNFGSAPALSFPKIELERLTGLLFQRGQRRSFQFFESQLPSSIQRMPWIKTFNKNLKSFNHNIYLREHRIVKMNNLHNVLWGQRYLLFHVFCKMVQHAMSGFKFLSVLYMVKA